MCNLNHTMDTLVWLPTTEGTLSILWWPEDFDPQTNWLHKTLQFPRTLTGWWREVETLRRPLFGNPAPFGLSFVPETPSPFALYKTAAQETETFLTKNLRLRWICRKWLQRVRRRCMDRRTHGAESDLVLCEPILPADCVSVYDLRSRSRYMFHVSTIHKIFVESLSYQSFGIANPQYPKNPYTNLPWSFGQTIVLVQQMQARIWSAKHTFVHRVVYAFRCAGYCLESFIHDNAHALQVLAAKQYFSDVEDSADVRVIYMEVFEDILDGLNISVKRVLYDALKQRTLGPTLLKEWDAILLSFWMFQNHTFFQHPTYTTVLEMVVGVKDMIRASMLYISQQPRQQPRQQLQQSQSQQQPRRPIVRARRPTPLQIQQAEIDDDDSTG